MGLELPKIQHGLLIELSENMSSWLSSVRNEIKNSVSFIKSKEVQTTDATQTHLLSMSLVDEKVYHVKAIITGIESDGSNRASYEIICTVYRDGGSATLQGSITVVHSEESDANWAATFTVNGNNLRVSVTGVAATTINWSATWEYLKR